MTRFFKTSKKKCTNYIYFHADGTKTAIEPNGDMEVFIELLHGEDDEAVNKNSHHEYYVNQSLHQTVNNDNGKDISLGDIVMADALNPLEELLTWESTKEQEQLISKLHMAMTELTPLQQETLKLFFLWWHDKGCDCYDHGSR
ncbi:hypothetical protein [Mycoplasma sp. P36-A1]|uniref:hypothetical protein n=1 Tax=Mycoplasma sp. P36-A1 TaxID=3252900 RepID=UPI003C2AB376